MKFFSELFQELGRFTLSLAHLNQHIKVFPDTVKQVGSYCDLAFKEAEEWIFNQLVGSLEQFKLARQDVDHRFTLRL